MTIPSSTVKSLCTNSEIALVRASRKGTIERHTDAELKRLAARARKLFDKWHGLSRGQSRARSRRVGFGSSDENTKVKAQIFRDALDSFQARLTAGEATRKPTATKSAPKTKRVRSAEHRATRAATRKGMTAVEDLLNVQQRKPPKPPAQAGQATAKSTAKPQAAEPPLRPAKGAVKARGTTKPTKGRTKAKSDKSVKQRDVVSAAKQSRIVRSGKTIRMRGHVSARGKRAQARRDSKN